MTYCEYIKTISGDQLQLHKEYHDNHYGFPLRSDYLPGAHSRDCPIYEKIRNIKNRK